MISQSISIQPGNSCLTYQVWIQSSDSCDVDFGGVGVNGLWHMAESLCAGTETGRWVSRRVEMEGYITSPLTPTIVLNLVATTDYSAASTMLIDDVAFADQSLCADSLHAFHLGEAEKQLVGRQLAGDK